MGAPFLHTGNLRKIVSKLQKMEEDIGVAAKAKAKEISMEEALWKSADKLRG